MRLSAFRLVLLVGLLLLALPATGADAAQTFAVTRTPDSNVGGCEPTFCTLRQAIEAADAAGSGSRVIVPTGTYTLAYGELVVAKPIAIEGAGSSLTFVDGGGASRVFDFTAGAAPAGLAKLTVQHGRVTSTAAETGGGGIKNLGSLTVESVVVRKNTVNPQEGGEELESAGGGILNRGSLTILGSEIAENIVEPASAKGARPANGAGIQNAGALRIVESAIVRNEAAGTYPVAGIFSRRQSPGHPSSLELVRSRIEGNDAQAGAEGHVDGAGLLASETNLTVRESTIAGNRAAGPQVSGTAFYFGYGGSLSFESSTVSNNVGIGSEVASAAIVIAGERTDPMRIVDSTIAGNETTGPFAVGGIVHFGESNLEIASSTISGNRAFGSEAKGGNLYSGNLGGYATTVRDTIVSGGVASAGFENCYFNKPQSIVSAGHNLDSANQCGFSAAGDRVNADPRLGALSANGGPTATMALLAGSAALDEGAECPPTDQRGVARPQGTACDIGAYELAVTPAAVPPVTPVTPAIVPPPTSPHPAGLRFLAKKVRVGPESGTGGLRVSCASDRGDRCLVVLTLRVKAHRHHGAAASAARKGRGTAVGSASGTIAGGAVGQLRVRLNARGRALLAAGPRGFGVTATGSSRNTSGAAVAIRHRLRIVPRASTH